METLRKPHYLSALVALCLLSIVAVGNISMHSKARVAAICADMRRELSDAVFLPVAKQVHAKAYIAYDFTDRIELTGKNEQEALPLASLTKLMTIRVALKSVSPEATYTSHLADLLSEDYVSFGVGETYHVRDLVKAALVASSNNSATMLARNTGQTMEAFIGSMNAEAANLMLPSLRFQSVTGLDEDNDTIPTAYGSAHDLLSLLERDFSDFPELVGMSTLRSSTITSTEGRTLSFSNTDLALKSIADIAASKTGYTDTAGGNLAVLWHDQRGHLMGAAVLGSTVDGRFADITAITKAANTYSAVSENGPAVCSASK